MLQHNTFCTESWRVLLKMRAAIRGPDHDLHSGALRLLLKLCKCRHSSTIRVHNNGPLPVIRALPLTPCTSAIKHCALLQVNCCM